MTIILKNNQTLNFGEFNFKCCIGKKGKTFNKKEGDLKTPKGFLNWAVYILELIEKINP